MQEQNIQGFVVDVIYACIIIVAFIVFFLSIFHWCFCSSIIIIILLVPLPSSAYGSMGRSIESRADLVHHLSRHHLSLEVIAFSPCSVVKKGRTLFFTAITVTHAFT